MKSSIFRLCSYFDSTTSYFIGPYGLNDKVRATFKLMVNACACSQRHGNGRTPVQCVFVPTLQAKVQTLRFGSA
jgi:hypothetical protein